MLEPGDLDLFYVQNSFVWVNSFAVKWLKFAQEKRVLLILLNSQGWSFAKIHQTNNHLILGFLKILRIKEHVVPKLLDNFAELR